VAYGTSAYHHINTGSANQDSTIAKAGPCVLHGAPCWAVGNAAAVFVKLYDKATGPTSADTPVRVIILPGNGAVGSGNNYPTVATRFNNGLSYRVTGLAADNDATGVAAGEVGVELDFA